MLNSATPNPNAPVVLVADPDPAQQQVLSDCLRQRFRVVTASNLAETVQKLVVNRPRILLLEINQPDGNGIELIRQIRRDPGTHNTIIACVTSRNAIKDKVAGFQAGADDYIIKPVNPDSFPWRLVLLIRLHGL
jgi:DNA-binding response OmpR family regulator